MTDPVLRVLLAREAFSESGYSKGLMVSGALHATTLLAVIILAWLGPHGPVLRTDDIFVVELPKGGGGSPQAETVVETPAEVAPPETKPEVKPPAAPILIKPEKQAPKKGLAPLESKKNAKTPRKMESRDVATAAVEKPSIKATATPSVSPQSNPANSGLEFLPQTPGSATGTDGPTGALGFYLAAAKAKITAAWARQIRPDFSGSVKVAFTIHRDGSIDGVQVIESSGTDGVDRLAQRAVLSTQLGPLPSSYVEDTILIHANFKPIS